MGEIQIWQKDGCGTDSSTLRKVIGEFRENGVQGIESSSCLTEYIKRLSYNRLLEMYEIDSCTTLQIMADCLGISETVQKAIYMAIETGSYFINETIEQNGWISQKEFEEAHEKHEKQLTEARAKADATRMTLREVTKQLQAAEQEIEDLKFEIVTLKAKLYDTYEAIHNPTDKNEAKGDHNKCIARTEKTPSGSWA